MSKLEKYEVLSILSADNTSTSYKIKNTDTSEVFVWKAFVYNDAREKQALLDDLEKCMLQLEQPSSLHIYDYIVYEDRQIVYVTCDFCINGNLANAIQTCRAQNYYLDEGFLWRVVYELAVLYKPAAFELKLNDVFLDADFSVKLFRFRLAPCNNFAEVVKELCAFGAPYYTKEFGDLLKFISDAHNPIDAILRHPTVLTKNKRSNPVVITDIYIKNPDSTRQDNAKNHKLHLKNLEEKLKLKEYELHKREKKIALQERLVREKVAQAELYLKRCRVKPVLKLEDIETSPSVVSKRTDRRVQFKGFKGHSPLKEIAWNKAESTGSKKTLFGKGRPVSEGSCRPISWTEETKQHAFDLLRIMNKEGDENAPVLKHTYL